MYFDCIDWHFDVAYSSYCKRFDCNKNLEHQEVLMAVDRYAATHIGMYLAWIIKQDLVSDLHQKNDKRDLEKVKNEEMTGTEFFLKNCDGTLSSDNLNEPGLEFTRAYYQEDYIKDFLDIAFNRFDLKHCPYEIEDNWENYLLFETVISEAYKQFIIKKKTTDLLKSQNQISINQKYYLVWKIKAWANYEQNLLEEAEKCINIAIKINPKIADLYRLKGAILRSLGKFQEALECFNILTAV